MLFIIKAMKKQILSAFWREYFRSVRDRDVSPQQVLKIKHDILQHKVCKLQAGRVCNI